MEVPVPYQVLTICMFCKKKNYTTLHKVFCSKDCLACYSFKSNTTIEITKKKFNIK